jgi:hypothetical protein
MIHPLSGLLHPQRVVVFGPTQQAGSMAESVWSNLQAGAVSAIAIDANQPTDHNHFTTLDQAPWQPDLALITDGARQALVDCNYANVPLAVVGQDIENDGRGATRTLHSGAYGLMRPQQHIAASCLPVLSSGKVALLSQSGIVAASLSQLLRRHQLGCSLFAVVDRVSDVKLHELLWLLGEDEQTEVIGVYLEEPIQDRFLLDTIARLVKQRPVLVLTSAMAKDSLLYSLYSQTGALLADSLNNFESLLMAITQPAHPAFSQFIQPSSLDKQTSWRYASALRRLSGVPNTHWLGLSSAGVKPQSKLPQSPIVWLNDEAAAKTESSMIRATGAIASVHQAMLHLDSTGANQLSDGIKTSLRQQLQAMPGQTSARLPQLVDWLEQAQVPIVKGAWLDKQQSLDWQIKQLGWPVSIWNADMTKPVLSMPLDSLSAVRQATRQTNKAWIQPMPQGRLELHFSAQRHPQFGPILHGQLASMYDSHHQIDHLLPLNASQAQQLIRQLGIYSLAVQTSARPDQIIDDVAKTILAVSQLFISLPELQRLDLDPVLVCHDGAKVADALLEWEAYEVAAPVIADSSY